jgi:hypothetical protein
MYKYFLLGSLILCLSSCFETIEEMHLNKNGTGSFKYILNFSQSKNEINSALKFDTFFGFKLPGLNEIKKKVYQAKANLSNSKGISNVQLKEDWTNYILEMSGQFATVEQFNQAFKDVSVSLGADESVVRGGFFYEKTDTAFKRTVVARLTPQIQNSARNIIASKLTNVSYTFILKNEKEMDLMPNPKAKLSPSKKAVLVRMTGNDLLDNPEYMDVKVKF